MYMKTFFVIIAGFLAALYLINPTFGLFELIPDTIPGVGNIDEAFATTVLLGALGYFGIDVKNFFGKKDA